MDAGAKAASGGKGMAWHIPEVWTEIGGSVFLTFKGRLVVNQKEFLHGYSSEHLRVYRDSKDPTVPRPWTHHLVVGSWFVQMAIHTAAPYQGILFPQGMGQIRTHARLGTA